MDAKRNQLLPGLRVRGDLHGNADPRNQLSGGYQVDPPVQDLNCPGGDLHVRQTSHSQSQNQGHPWYASLVGLGEDRWREASLRQSKQRSTSGEHERVGGRVYRDKNEGVDDIGKYGNAETSHGCQHGPYVSICHDDTVQSATHK